MKTLLYLASGKYYPEYEDLPFDQLIFVDKSRSCAASYPENPPRIRFICKDALLAIDDLLKEQVKIDCLVVINEGLFGGGGSYPMFSDFLMGYLSPLLKDEFILITDVKHYNTTKYKALTKLDWAVEKVSELQASEQDYINPAIFANYGNNTEENFGNVFAMRKINKNISFASLNSKIKINLIHGSIWEEVDNLDFVGLNLQTPSINSGSTSIKINNVSNFFLSKINVVNVSMLSIEQIIAHCENHGAKKIGIVPWGCSAYDQVIPYLSRLENCNLKEIRFYHLNANDFSDLFDGYVNFIFDKYPEFFCDIAGDKYLRSSFYDVVKQGYGEAILKLCEIIDYIISSGSGAFKFSQIKLKFGKLRLYSRTRNEYFRGLMRMCEELGN